MEPIAYPRRPSDLPSAHCAPRPASALCQSMYRRVHAHPHIHPPLGPARECL